MTDKAPKRTETTPIEGGWIKRDAATNRIIAVQVNGKETRATPQSKVAIESVSAMRRAALARLADR